MNFNYYPQTYNPMSVTPSGGLNWVQGLTGAKAYFVPAGQAALLMDSEGQKFYIKQTDTSGMPLPIRTYTYTEVKEAPSVDSPNYVTRSEFDELVKRIDEIKEAKHESAV